MRSSAARRGGTKLFFVLQDALASPLGRLVERTIAIIAKDENRRAGSAVAR